ncbi:MAG TPA: PAC2 family protein [Gaiellales bacterium]|nr:PAC2 family protein [Gaiellales bacterium]
MALYRIAPDLPPLHNAVLIASFDGWVDAAEAASGAVAQIGSGGQVVASFDGDGVFDYRSRRPLLDIQDGCLSELGWPELTIRHVRTAGRDLLVFSGAEPDLRWRQLAADVVELTGRLNVVEWISVGAVPAAVAHTRPVPVMATASRDGLLTGGDLPGPEGLLRVPAAALSALEMAVSTAGVPAVGFFAQVPPYASIGYAAASIALIERLSRHLQIGLDPGQLEHQRGEQQQRYDAALAGDPVLRETVTRLEAAAGDVDLERLPSGDELAREIQRYLRGQGEPGGG